MKITHQLEKTLTLVREGRYRELLDRAGKKAVKAARTVRANRRDARAQSLARQIPPIDSQAAKAVFQRMGQLALEHFLCTPQKLIFPASPKPKVTVLLILFNKAELTFACLRSLLEIRDVALDVVIIDNASSDATGALLDRIEGAQIIRNKDNTGFLLACNQGARMARGEHLLLLNNDTVVLPGSLEAAIRTLESGPDVGAVGARIINLDGRLQEAGSFFLNDGACRGFGRADTDPSSGPFMYARDTDYCSAAFLLTRLSTFRELGGFDERYAPAYYEDADFCMRLWKKSLRVVYEPKAAILHYEFASSTAHQKAVELMLAHQKIFRDLHRDALDHATEPGPAGAGPPRALLGKDARRRLLFIEDRVPHITIGAGYPRSNEILRQMEALGFEVTFYPTDTRDETWPTVYSDVAPSVEVMMGLGEAGLESFLGGRRNVYDVIFVSRPGNMKAFGAIRERHPGWFAKARVIYDAEAFFCLRDYTHSLLTEAPWNEAKLEKALAREAGLARGCAAVLSVSERERAIFERHGVEHTRVLSYGAPERQGPATFEARRDFLFVGSFHFHPSPNSDSVLWFAREIFPKIQAELGSDVKLILAGLNKTTEIKALESPSIRVLGVVPDLSTVFDTARIFVAPTRFSAGIPLKVQEAASYGIPVVATDLIASQLDWEGERELLTADRKDPEAFARQCVRLYRDAALWDQLRKRALDRIRRDCSPELFRRTLQETLG